MRREMSWRAALPALWRDERVIAGGLVLSLALYYLVPSPLLSLPFLLAYAALAYRRLGLALCLLPLAFPFWYVPKRVLPHTVFPLSEIALAVCVGVALARAARGREWARPMALARRCVAGMRALAAWVGWPRLAALAVFLVGGTVGVLVARRPHEALRAWRWEVIEPPLYCALLLLYARGPRATRWLVGALLASAALLGALAFVQFSALHVTFAPIAAGNRLISLPREAGGYRATAFIYGSGNALAAYLERILPFAVALLPEPVSAGTGRPRARWALTAVVAVTLLAILATGSRGAAAATVGALVALGALALAGPSRRLIGVAVAAPALLMATVLSIPLGLLLLQPQLFAEARAISFDLRPLVWLAALHMLRDHPLLGIGLDQFVYYYSSHFSAHPYWITALNGQPTQVWREPDLAHPHNLVLDLWLSMGLAGLLAFTAFAGATLRRGVRLWRSAGGADPWRAAVGLGICGSLAAGLLHGMVDSAYFAPDLALLFWLAVALALLEGPGAHAPLARHGTMGARAAVESQASAGARRGAS
jgi:putative inorganic carbon (hco3(-)) transporter